MTDKKNDQLQFTYFLGAGASMETVPLVKEFKNGLDEFSKFLVKEQLKTSNTTIDDLNNDVIDLANKLALYASFDTFAKKLYLTKNIVNLSKYKKVLATFILYCNIYKNIDKRYDLFFSSILERINGVIKIPSNVNLISWNYDRLAETALQYLLGTNSFSLNEYINVFNNYKLNEKKPIDEVLNIVKLNGSAGIYINEESYRGLDSINEIIAYYLNPGIEGTGGHISFSWETHDSKVIETRKAATQIMSKTDHLIVIGYSFPTFNRQMDYELLKSLKHTTKIHLQIPELNIKSVKQRLCALTGLSETSTRILEYTGTDEFFIPYEFNNILSVPPGTDVGGAF